MKLIELIPIIIASAVAVITLPLYIWFWKKRKSKKNGEKSGNKHKSFSMFKKKNDGGFYEE